MDAAHRATDKELKVLERKIKKEYQKAYNECRAEMEKIMANIQAHPEWTREKRLIEMNKYNRLDSLCDQMAGTIQNATKTAREYIDHSSANVYVSNFNHFAKDLSFSLIDNTVARNILKNDVNPFELIAFGKATNKGMLVNNLRSEMITAMLKGESIPKIARRIRNLTERNLADCIRIARTETTRIENAARAAIGDEGERLGFKMGKRWIATMDDRTRDAHFDMDGVEVLKDEPFNVDGEELMYPGDISLGASAANVCNCRCTVIYFIMKR